MYAIQEKDTKQRRYTERRGSGKLPPSTVILIAFTMAHKQILLHLSAPIIRSQPMGASGKSKIITPAIAHLCLNPLLEQHLLSRAGFRRQLFRVSLTRTLLEACLRDRWRPRYSRRLPSARDYILLRRGSSAPETGRRPCSRARRCALETAPPRLHFIRLGRAVSSGPSSTLPLLAGVLLVIGIRDAHSKLRPQRLARWCLRM